MIESLTLETASQAWEQLTDYVTRFLTAWKSAPPPPELRGFLPAQPPALRRMVLVELIKIDLEQRQESGAALRSLEDYHADFPELGDVDTIPCDLIYEDYRTRRDAGQTVDYDDYLQRYPRQAGALRRLVGLGSTRIVKSSHGDAKGADLAPGQSLDDFEILARLGEGTFARVYLARQKSMQRRVAVKLSARQSDEPQTMAQLDHPNIVRVFDQRPLPDDDLHLVYMEFVPGGSLQALLDKVRRTPPALRCGALLAEVVDHALGVRGETPAAPAWRQKVSQLSWSATVCWLGTQLASALDYAHRHHTLHRDIKPANVLLSAEGVPKLVDFNMSYSSKLEGASPAAFFGGTLGYMSPEHLEAYSPHHDRRPDQLDGQCDLYGLAVILWELLTGNRPFADAVIDDDWETTLGQMIARRRQGVPAAALCQLPADLPPGLREVLLRCLAPQPQDRLASAGQMARELSLCLNPGVCAARQRRRGRGHDLAMRYPLTFATTVAVLPNLLLSVVNVNYDWFAIVAPRLPPNAQLEFVTLITLFKALLYAMGLTIGVTYVLPVFVPFRRPVDARRLRRARQKALGMGLMVFWVSLGAWGASGVLFPAWIHVHHAHVALSDYVHFFVSHALCGLVAGTFSFFLLSQTTTRLLYPRLLEMGPADESEVEPLLELREQLPLFGRVALVTPFLALIAMGLGNQDFRLGFAGLAVLGLGAVSVSLRLVRQTQADLDALVLAVGPDSALLAHSLPPPTANSRRHSAAFDRSQSHSRETNS